MILQSKDLKKSVAMSEITTKGSISKAKEFMPVQKGIHGIPQYF